MIENLNTLIDEIRKAERHLSDIASQQSSASAASAKARQAVEEQTDVLERLALSERSLTEAGERLRAKAARSLKRGLLPDELPDALTPLALASRLREAGGIVTDSKDQESKVMLEVQKISNEANAALKQVEEDFIEAEAKLEELRDQLRILQQQPATA